MNRTRSLLRLRPARRRLGCSFSFEGLEVRTLLSAATGMSITSAIPLAGPAASVVGTVAAATPVFYQVDPAADSLLVAEVATSGAAMRLELLDAQGQLLLTSDGASATNPDPEIQQHLGSGTDYLVVESRDGNGGFVLTVSLLASSMPDQPVTLTIPTANPPAPPTLPSAPSAPTLPSAPSAPTLPSCADTSSTDCFFSPSVDFLGANIPDDPHIQHLEFERVDGFELNFLYVARFDDNPSSPDRNG